MVVLTRILTHDILFWKAVLWHCIDYPVRAFNGRKFLLLSEVSWFGGRNLFLGSAYLATGIIAVIAGIVLLLVHLLCSRWWVLPLGWVRYPSSSFVFPLSGLNCLGYGKWRKLFESPSCLKFQVFQKFIHPCLSLRCSPQYYNMYTVIYHTYNGPTTLYQSHSMTLIALFLGPAQLFIACSTEKWGPFCNQKWLAHGLGTRLIDTFASWNFQLVISLPER